MFSRADEPVDCSTGLQLALRDEKLFNGWYHFHITCKLNLHGTLKSQGHRMGKIYHIRATETSTPARALFHETGWMVSILEGPFSCKAAIIPKIEAAET
jgi:hypothetical protein